MAASRKNYDAAVEMYKSGMSVEDVALMYKVSRQSMWKSLARRGVQFRSNLKFGKENTFYREGADRSIGLIVKKKIQQGRLIISPCEVCGVMPEIVKGRQIIQAHHDDYNFPLKVRWMCYKCHFAWHACNSPIPRSSSWRPMSRSEICSLGGKANWAKGQTNMAKIRSARKKK